MQTDGPASLQQAKQQGASRNEVISAILVGLPAAGHGVTQVLPAALAAYEQNLPEVLALSRLAGMDETIASVRVKYYGREFGVAETGAPAHPGAVVDHALDPNSYTTRPTR